MRPRIAPAVSGDDENGEPSRPIRERRSGERRPRTPVDKSRTRKRRRPNPNPNGRRFRNERAGTKPPVANATSRSDRRATLELELESRRPFAGGRERGTGDSDDRPAGAFRSPSPPFGAATRRADASRTSRRDAPRDTREEPAEERRLERGERNPPELEPLPPEVLKRLRQ
jgi:hypothetical protein